MKLKNYKIQWLLKRLIATIIILMFVFACACCEHIVGVIAGLTN